MIEIKTLEELFRKNGIPSTYEYPGHICVIYLQAEITVGLDGDVLMVQASYEGQDLPVNYARPVYPSTERIDVMDELITELSKAYDVIDTYLDMRGDECPNEGDPNP